MCDEMETFVPTNAVAMHAPPPRQSWSRGVWSGRRELAPARQSHLQTLVIYKLIFNKTYYAFT